MRRWREERKMGINRGRDRKREYNGEERKDSEWNGKLFMSYDVWIEKGWMLSLLGTAKGVWTRLKRRFLKVKNIFNQQWLSNKFHMYWKRNVPNSDRNPEMDAEWKHSNLHAVKRLSGLINIFRLTVEKHLFGYKNKIIKHKTLDKLDYHQTKNVIVPFVLHTVSLPLKSSPRTQRTHTVGL